MVRNLLLSLALTGTLLAQEPAKPETPPAPPKTPTLTDALKLAVDNHPEVKTAQAQLMLAQAAVDTAKMKASRELMQLYAKVDAVEKEFQSTIEQYRRLEQMNASGVVSETEIAAVRAKVQQLELAVEAAKRERDLILQLMPRHMEQENAKLDYRLNESLKLSRSEDAARIEIELNSGRAYLDTMLSKASQDGPIAALTAAIKNNKQSDFKVSLKGLTYGEVASMITVQFNLSSCPVIFSKNRINPDLENIQQKQIESDITLKTNLQGCLQFVTDEINDSNNLRDTMQYTVYVRDYGLFIATIDSAPQNAVTLAEFVEALNKKAEMKTTK
jgi:hypothetical protein